MEFTVIIVTHSRARVLADTLDAVSRVSYPGPWELLVVDNNSSDDTARIVSRAQAGFPVPLRYLFEPQQGKYHALNAGIGVATGTFIAATDDDALPAPDWLTHAREGLETYQCDFVGGRVYPVWEAEPPAWLDSRSAISEKVLGLQDNGDAPREYGRDLPCWPLGVNVAYRRDVFDRAGLFDARLGRVAGTLRNQSQREWHLRARAAGARGMYLPQMVVHHRVEADRVTQRYFHRWFYWHGISRAILSDTTGLDLFEPDSGVGDGRTGLLGLPPELWKRAARSCLSAARRRLGGRSNEAVPYELIVSFCAGVLRQRLAYRRPFLTRLAGRPS